MQNTCYNHTVQAGKTSNAEGRQDLPHKDFSVLKSIGKHAGVGWGHYYPKSRMESNIWVRATVVPSLLLGMGNTVPSSQNVHAHQHPYGPSTTLAHRCCEEEERSRGCTVSDLLVFPVLVGRHLEGTLRSSLATSAGTKHSSIIFLLSS